MDVAPAIGRLVDRVEELEAIRAETGIARAGASRLLVLVGHAGIGKSRLLAELDPEPGPDEITLTGSCPPIAGRELPFAAVAGTLRMLARRVDAAELDQVLGPSRAVLARLVPALGGQVQIETDPSEGLVLEHLLGVLERLSRRRALTSIVLEDLQWAGPSTWDLLAYLARNPIDAPLLVVGTLRPEEVEPGDRAERILAELWRSSSARVIEVGPIPDEAIVELARTHRPDLDPQAIATVVERAEGNPSIAIELASGTEPGRGEIPAGLAQALAARVGALPGDAQQLLRVAAVIGRRIDPDILLRASGLSEDAGIAALRRVVSTRLLEETSDGPERRLVFRPALLHDVVYGAILGGERPRLHASVARVLAADPESSGAGPERAVALAIHWREAGDSMRAFLALVKAAEVSERAFAFAEADRMYGQALAIAAARERPEAELRPIGFRAERPQPGAEWSQLLARAAEAASLAGEPQRALERIDEALVGASPGDATTRWRARRARYLLEAGRTSDALQAFEEVVSLGDALTPDLRPRLLVEQTRALASAGRYAEAASTGQAALTAAREASRPTEEWQALNAIGTALAHQGDAEAALAALEEAHRLTLERPSASMVRPRPSRIGDLMAGYADVVQALERTGQREAAADTARAAAGAAGRLGAAGWQGRFDISAAFDLYHLGRWGDAQALCDEAIAQGGSGSAAEASVVRARIKVATGDWEAAERDLESAQRWIDADPPPTAVAAYHLALAELALWRHRPRDAEEAVERGLQRLIASERALERAELCLIGIRVATEKADQARLRRASAEVATARESLDRHSAELRAVLEPDQPGVASRAGALLAAAAADATDEARASADGLAAADAWERIGEPYPAAYYRWRAADRLLSRRDRARATAVLRQAAAMADDLGARPLRGEIDALAARARIDLREADATDDGTGDEPGIDLGLSTREMEVLQLLAGGRTNRQIAEELFITEKTAGHHVSSILGKLGVATRLEAAGVAYRAGIMGIEATG
jgi:DNA-binding CsgD family transcriptional regulator